MIKDMPIPDEFFEAGRELLDFAWGTVFDLFTNLDQAEYFGYDKAEVTEPYWEAAKRRLSTALAIAQQGVELLLKGKICQISPYLLIGDESTKWPSPYKGKDISFNDFRMPDAQELIRIYDTCAGMPLSDEFRAKYHTQRERRNVIMHSTGKNFVVHAIEVVEAVLFPYRELFPDDSWLVHRKRFLQTAPDSELGSGDFASNRVCLEAHIVVEQLSPSLVHKYFNIDKKQHRFYCPHCLQDASTDEPFEHRLAVLAPKNNKSKRVYCFVCNKRHKVVRSACSAECGSSVLDEDGTCLLCGESDY
ncbi:hypothetical protein ACF8FB_01295 [Pseudomonas sp. yb_2]|uniref:hypothetical protein n=1 Tax=Pseudomonas sp. yb_2 TaxID=3367218 RepID=UPI00370AC14E